jgi:hypothetical protein
MDKRRPHSRLDGSGVTPAHNFRDHVRLPSSLLEIDDERLLIAGRGIERLNGGLLAVCISRCHQIAAKRRTDSRGIGITHLLSESLRYDRERTGRSERPVSHPEIKHRLAVAHERPRRVNVEVFN